MTQIPQSFFDGHMARVIDDLPCDFRWNGVDYQGVRTTPDISQEMEVGGVDEKIAFNLYVRASDLPTVKPDVGDTFLVGSVSYKVSGIAPSPDAGSVIKYTMAFARTGGTIES